MLAQHHPCGSCRAFRRIPIPPEEQKKPSQPDSARANEWNPIDVVASDPVDPVHADQHFTVADVIDRADVGIVLYPAES